jgi:hypothetical protein
MISGILRSVDWQTGKELATFVLTLNHLKTSILTRRHDSQQDLNWHGYILREEGTHCIFLIAHIALCKSRLTPAHCISLIVYLTSYILNLTPYILRLTSYILRLTSYILHLTPYTLRLTPYALRLTPYTLHLTPYILHLTPYILHLTSYILHLTSYILYHIVSYRILYRVTCIRLVCKTYP